MPIELPAEINKEKNRLATKSAMLWLLDITIDGVDDTLHFTNNNADIVYSPEYEIEPITHWKMDDNAATTEVRDSVNYNHGEAQQNTEDISVEGQFDTALSFNGSTDYIGIKDVIEAVENNTEGTIALWFKRDTVSSDEGLLSFSTNGGTSDKIEIYIGSDGLIYVVIYSDAEGEIIFYSPGATRYDDNTWHHIAVTMDSSGSNMYIDGSVVTPIYDSGLATDVIWFNDIADLNYSIIGARITETYIYGVYVYNYDDYFGGYIDSTVIYDFALTSTQIAQLFTEDQVTEIISNNYHKCNFEMGKWDCTDTSLPERELSISNADLINYLLPYIENYDGLVGATIIATPVNSNHFDLDMSAKAHEYTVLSCTESQEYIIFTLGMSNPLNQRFPLNKYFGRQCRYYCRFKGIECGYDGVETECNGTMARCDELDNLTRFGGQPGLRSKTVRFV